jgi:molybdopterin molybdotransferase
MLTYREALYRILGKVPNPKVIEVPLEESLNRVLGEDVVSDTSLPPFDKACMDGFAVRAQDVAEVPARLEVVATRGAGDASDVEVMTGQAVGIMTGASMPRGADSVQMVEKCRLGSGWVEVLESVDEGRHVSLKGSEVLSGDKVLEKGTEVGPAEIAVLASFGYAVVPIFAAPSSAVLSTGDELVEVDTSPGFGQIRNSNAWMLQGQCQRLGMSTERLPVVRDRPEDIGIALRKVLAKELIILSGGVSMGEFDYVHKVLESEGYEIVFHKASIKPGKPVVVACIEGKMVFGLPGNPVSAFVTFEMFVRPVVRKWMGFSEVSPKKVKAELQQEARKETGRLFFMPARLEWIDGLPKVTEIRTRGSADIVHFSKANSLLLFPAEESVLRAGSEVDVIPL